MKKSEILDKVEALVEEIAPGLNVSMVDVEFVRESGNDFLRVYIDRDGGVRMEDCEALSRDLGHRLDDLDFIPGSYYLEVSSPGAERVLKKDREYNHFAGKRVAVTLFAPAEYGRKFQAQLVGLRDGMVTLTLDDGTPLSLPREKIARVALSLEPKGGKSS